jgi:uncharacterized membrane protein
MLISAIIMLALDFTYIFINKNAFIKQVELVQRSPIKVNFVGAACCYAALIFGLYYFILKDHRSVTDAFLFGLIAYTVYDGTTYALLEKWSPYLALMDAVWGGVLMASTTYFTYLITPYVK